MAKSTLLQFLRDQWACPVPLVAEDLAGKVVLITGANIGLGFEAAKHFASMNPERLIIACRSEAKGNEAIKQIKEATKFENVQLFLVDLTSYESVNAFCEKVDKEVPRLDILIENAALAQLQFIPTPDGWEHQLQVNHIATAQIAILLLPLLLRTASEGTSPRLVFISSATHHQSPPLNPPTSDKGILEWLNDPSEIDEYETNFSQAHSEYLSPFSLVFREGMQLRYPTSKLLNLFFARELASRLPEDSPLIINAVHPGLCFSGLRRHLPLSRQIIFWLSDLFITWSAERGSRQLVFGALGNKDRPDELKGAYISSSKVVEPSDYVISDEGAKVQKQLWHETLTVLSKVSPNVQSVLNSNNLL